MSVTTQLFFIVSSGHSRTQMMEKLSQAFPSVEMHHEYLCIHVQPLAVRYYVGLASIIVNGSCDLCGNSELSFAYRLRRVSAGWPLCVLRLWPGTEPAVDRRGCDSHRGHIEWHRLGR